MTDPVKLDSPFTVGDEVRPKESSDLPYLFTGRGALPGPIVAILPYGGHMVRHADGREFPYAPYELEKVST